MRTIRFKETNQNSWVFTINGISFIEGNHGIEITSSEVCLIKGTKGIEYFLSYSMPLDPVKRMLDSKISFRHTWPANQKEATALAINFAKEVLDF